MALKGHRKELDGDMLFYMNEVCYKGSVVCFSTFGSGEALDQSAALVTVAATASGNKPAGLLMDDMVNLDLTKQHPNMQKYQVQKGGKVFLLTHGEVTTDQIASGITIAAGDNAYLANGGRVTNVNTGEAASPKIGRFKSKKDEDGFAKVEISLP